MQIEMQTPRGDWVPCTQNLLDEVECNADLQWALRTNGYARLWESLPLTPGFEPNVSRRMFTLRVAP